jgi:hypothetical protein
MQTLLNQSDIKLQVSMPHFLGLCLISAFLSLACAGCEKGAVKTANIDPTGVYALVSVNGKNLPCEVNHDGTVLTIKSGVFTIKADNNCSSLISCSVPSKGDISREVKAIYSCQGAELFMQWDEAGMTFGTVNGNTFTMTNEGMAYIYRK